MVDGTGSGSALGTSPGGLALDSNGDLIVAVSGRSNPGDPGGERGGLFRFDTAGNLLGDPLAAGSIAFSSVVVFTPPAPATVVDSFVYHNAWTGPGSAIDTVKSLRKVRPQTLICNLINSCRALTGSVSISKIGITGGGGGGFRVPDESPRSVGQPIRGGWIARGSRLGSGDSGLTGSRLDHLTNSQIENRWLRVTIKPRPTPVWLNRNLLGPLVGQGRWSPGGSFQLATPMSRQFGLLAKTFRPTATWILIRTRLQQFRHIRHAFRNWSTAAGNITVP